jgi:hypothetical protein
MKINLLTKEQHSTLLEIYKNFPSLTLQNKGYEGIKRSDFTDEEKKADKEVNEILKKSITGFSRFQNFLLDKNNELQIRLQYNYNYEPNSGLPFIGVGYILLDELLNGFRK